MGSFDSFDGTVRSQRPGPPGEAADCSTGRDAAPGDSQFPQSIASGRIDHVFGADSIRRYDTAEAPVASITCAEPWLHADEAQPHGDVVG